MPRPEGLAALLGPDGEVAEWSIAPHSKCGIRATVSGVRIPPSPPAPIGPSKVTSDCDAPGIAAQHGGFCMGLTCAHAPAIAPVLLALSAAVALAGQGPGPCPGPQPRWSSQIAHEMFGATFACYGQCQMNSGRNPAARSEAALQSLFAMLPRSAPTAGRYDLLRLSPIGASKVDSYFMR